jgi:hypothetical protein
MGSTSNVVGLTGRGLAYLAVGQWRDARGALTNAVGFIPEAVHQNRLADYRARMRRKYEHAANHPWITVSPDPTPPD